MHTEMKLQVALCNSLIHLWCSSTAWRTTTVDNRKTVPHPETIPYTIHRRVMKYVFHSILINDCMACTCSNWHKKCSQIHYIEYQLLLAPNERKSCAFQQGEEQHERERLCHQCSLEGIINHSILCTIWMWTSSIEVMSSLFRPSTEEHLDGCSY